MDSDKLIRLRRIWNQKTIPVVQRKNERGEKLRVRLPYDAKNRRWLRNHRRAQPHWNARGQYWELPKAWFNDLVERALNTYGAIYVIQPYKKQEKCAPACRNARGHVCQCSCMGANHGQGDNGSWFDISDTFSVRSIGNHVACRLMSRK